MPQWLPRTLLAAALINAALFAAFVAATIVVAPVYDMIDDVLLYASDRSALSYLWAPHNEHRIVWTRALLAVDLKFLGGTGLLFILCSIVLLALMLGVLLRASVRAPMNRAQTMVIAALLMIAMLPTSIVTVCSMAAMSANLQCAAFAVLAFALFDDGKSWKVAASLIFAMASALGGSAGLLVWPVLAVVAWRSDRPLVWGPVVAALTIAVWAVVLKGLPSQADVLTISFARLLASLDYGLRFLGLPWSHAPQLVWPGRLIGAMILIWSGCLIANAMRAPRRADPAERLGLRLIGFALLVAAITALARWNIATDREMPVRYTIFVVLAHAGLILASWRSIVRLLTGPIGNLARPALAVATGILLVQQVVVGQAAAQQTARYNDAWRRFVAGDWTPDMVQYVYPDEARARQAREVLKRDRLYGL